MKTEPQIKHYASRNDYIQNRTNKKALSLIDEKDSKSLKNIQDKVELSPQSKEKAMKPQKSMKDDLKENLKQNKNEIKKASSHLLSDALGVAKNALQMPGVSSLADIATGVIPDNSPIKEVSEVLVEKDEQGLKDGARVIFVSGLHLAGISEDGEGLESMANHIENSQHFSWKDEDKILQEISRTPKDEPVVLVGHSLGGDGVVSISNKLNTLEYGFRKVDLLVTLDSVGFDNDLIPNNVKKNLNFISNKDMFFNDGPNIARNLNKTEVINELRQEKHTELDDSNDIQQSIFAGIDEVLSDYKNRSEEKNQMKNLFMNMMKEYSSASNSK
ncbi:hypothetical protein [Halobacteriovorax sp. HLS]|uniref:hypothetical protein n=1 Tax=Halobacteriovorax sp. HLS TaxID=2234000 RepID=UPI000FD93D71|nr:hypothetical protein [Halobacteriovorax sp. HLS]